MSSPLFPLASSILLFSFLFLAISSQISSTNGAVARAMVKAGSEYSLTVPGKLIVKRVTKANAEPQYLFAGNQAWTTDGNNRIGSAQLDFATGKLVIPNFNENDVGSYTFPLEPPNFSEGNNGTCAMAHKVNFPLQIRCCKMANYVQDRLAGRQIWWCPGGQGHLAFCPQPTDPDGYTYCCQYYYLDKDRPSCCRFPMHTGLLISIVLSAIVLFLLLLFLTCWFCPNCPIARRAIIRNGEEEEEQFMREEEESHHHDGSGADRRTSSS